MTNNKISKRFVIFTVALMIAVLFLTTALLWRASLVQTSYITATIKNEHGGGVDELPHHGTIVIDNRALVDRLLREFPQMGTSEKGVSPWGWSANVSIKFARKDGQITTVYAEDKYWNFDEGHWDWQLAPGFYERLRDIIRAQQAIDHRDGVQNGGVHSEK